MDLYGAEELKFINEGRSKKALLFVSLMSLVLAGKLWQLQIFQGKKFRAFSDQNTIKEQKVQAPRGPFLDRFGRPLVTSRPGYRLSLAPQTFRKANRKRLKEIVSYISNQLGFPPKALLTQTISNHRKGHSFLPGVVAKEISQDQALFFKRARLQFPELRVEEHIFRDYLLGPSGAQIFGYVSTATKAQVKKQKGLSGAKRIKAGDQVGQSGLELKLDSYVRGVDGIAYVQVDARGRLQDAAGSLISSMGLNNVPAKMGNTVVLTMDRDLQKAAYQAFFRKDATGERKGGLVALNTQGEVLAWASNPSFDPALFQTGLSSKVWRRLNNNTYKPLRDKVAQGTYSPGSVFKPFVGLAALYYNHITPYTLLESPGRIFFGGRPYHDSRAGGHGTINIKEALEVSGNVFFYKLGLNMGVNKMTHVISRLGLGSPTNINFVQESAGLLPSTEWKLKNRQETWYKGEDLSYAIGQGYVLTSLLQLAKGYLALATEGKVYRPLLVKEVLSSKGKSLRSFKTKLVEDLTQESSLSVNPKHFKTIKEGLIRVAHGERGTARYRSSKIFKMAGKTGTAQVRGFSADGIYKKCENRPEETRHHGFFVGFAPANKPEIVVAGLALHSCHGSSGAAPMVTDLLTAYMKKHHTSLFEKSSKKLR